MQNLADVTKKIYVLYHSDWDGIVAAWVASKFLIKLELIPVQYGSGLPELEKGCPVLILDFSYPPDEMEEIIENSSGAGVILLDHHTSAIKKLESWRNFITLGDGAKRSFYKWEGRKTEAPVDIILHEGCAGCMMTWNYFNVGYPAHSIKEPPALVKYAQDHDLYKFELPDSRSIRAVMRSLPLNFDSCERLQYALEDPNTYHSLVQEGKGILSYMEVLVKSAVKHAEEMIIAGHRCLGTAVNGDGNTSEIANRLAREAGYDFGVCWFKSEGTKWVYELRSVGDFDVSEVAEKMGGGGHKNAAGFSSIQPPTSFLVYPYK